MVGKVELIPLSEGTRITIKQNEKVIVGRGSSLGCNEKRISRHHAELLLKDDNTLWITPTHVNPVFFRPPNGKIIQLAKDIERELKDGDHIGLLPSSFFFRVSFSIDVNNNNENNDSDADSLYGWKKEEKYSPLRVPSPDPWSPTAGYRRSTSNQDISVFDFDDDIVIEPMPPSSRRVSFERRSVTDAESNQVSSKNPSLEKKTMVDLEPIQAPCKRPSLDKKSITDVESTEASSEHPSVEIEIKVDAELMAASSSSSEHPSPGKKATEVVVPTKAPHKHPSLEEKMDTDTELISSISKSYPTISLRRIFIPSPTVEDQDDKAESIDTNDDKAESVTTNDDKTESVTTNDDKSESMDMNDDKTRKLPKWMIQANSSPVVIPTTTTPKRSYSRNSSHTASARSKRDLSVECEGNGNTNDSSNLSDTHSPATTNETKSPGKLLSRIPATRTFDSDDDIGFDSVTTKSPPKKRRSGGKRRQACQFGATCYRKNPSHRAEQSHPGDSDYEGSKQSDNANIDDDDSIDEKPDCPFGKACYRQNPQHKRDFKH